MLDAIRLRLVRDDRGIGRFLIVGMALGFACLLAAMSAAVWMTTRAQDHTRWVNHTYEIEVKLGRLRTLTEQAETARRGYMLMPGLPTFLDTYREAADAVPPVLDDLRTLTADNPLQQERLRRLAGLIADLREQRELTNQLVRNGSVDAAIAAFRADTAYKRLRTVRNLMADMEDAERTLLKVRDREQRDAVFAFYVALGVTAALLLAVALVTLATILRYTRDLTASRDTLHLLNDTLEDQVEERTADLSRANDEIQRFAYIVSHDLRSPLVNVMGFTAELETSTKVIAELIDRAEAEAPALVTDEVRFAAREDLPEAIGFIRTSTAKMDRLINAILKLSREGRRVIAPEQLDMGGLINGVRDTLQHRLDEVGGKIVVEGALPTITSDRLAIEQVFTNVIENAVKYRHAARAVRIVVRGEATAARVIFEIQDNGRGIDPRDHARVFDLFRRSGTQDQPGEGIGLAHVRALTYRLGGTIDVASTLGDGATFRIDLPIKLDIAGPTT